MRRTRGPACAGLAIVLAGLGFAASVPAHAATAAATATAAAKAKPVAAVPVAAPAADPVAGRAKADDERCIECHGPRDAATAQPGDGLHAWLDGQPVAYLAKQMRDFREGAREHAVMTLVSRNLEPADVADIVAYFASRPAPAASGTDADDAALRLYAEGDSARRIVACATCHGGAGQLPATPDTPRLAGQDAAYLAAQLRNWRSGDRHNSAGGLMNASAKELSDAEIQALATRIAAMK